MIMIFFRLIFEISNLRLTINYIVRSIYRDRLRRTFGYTKILSDDTSGRVSSIVRITSNQFNHHLSQEIFFIQEFIYTSWPYDKAQLERDIVFLQDNRYSTTRLEVYQKVKFWAWSEDERVLKAITTFVRSITKKKRHISRRRSDNTRMKIQKTQNDDDKNRNVFFWRLVSSHSVNSSSFGSIMLETWNGFLCLAKSIIMFKMSTLCDHTERRVRSRPNHSCIIEKIIKQVHLCSRYHITYFCSISSHLKWEVDNLFIRYRYYHDQRKTTPSKAGPVQVKNYEMSVPWAFGENQAQKRRARPKECVQTTQKVLDLQMEVQTMEMDCQTKDHIRQCQAPFRTLL